MQMNGERDPVAKIRQQLLSHFFLFFCATFRGIGRNEHVLTIVNVGNIALNLITANNIGTLLEQGARGPQKSKIWNDRELTLTSLRNICKMNMKLIYL